MRHAPSDNHYKRAAAVWSRCFGGPESDVSIIMKKIAIITVVGLGLLAGCAGRPSLFPNSDPALQKTSAEFAADAAKRQPYKNEAPRGGEAMGRAEYDLTFGHLQILNTSEEDWDNVEVWVNQKYVCAIPKI